MKNDLYLGVVKTFKIADFNTDIVLVASLNEFDVTEFDESRNGQQYYLEFLPVIDRILVAAPAMRLLMYTFSKEKAIDAATDIIKNINCVHDNCMNMEIIKYKDELLGVILYHPYTDDNVTGACQVRFSVFGDVLKRDCKSISNAYQFDIFTTDAWHLECDNENLEMMEYGKGKDEMTYKGLDMPVRTYEGGEWSEEKVKVVHIDRYAPVN